MFVVVGRVPMWSLEFLEAEVTGGLEPPGLMCSALRSWAIFLILFWLFGYKTGSHHVAQVVLELTI